VARAKACGCATLEAILSWKRYSSTNICTRLCHTMTTIRQQSTLFSNRSWTSYDMRSSCIHDSWRCMQAILCTRWHEFSHAGARRFTAMYTACRNFQGQCAAGTDVPDCKYFGWASFVRQLPTDRKYAPSPSDQTSASEIYCCCKAAVGHR
jgi:hypothetical protein